MLAAKEDGNWIYGS